MEKRFVFGKRELTITLGASAVFCIISIIQRLMIDGGLIELNDSMYLHGMILAIIGAIFGPFQAVLIAFVGHLLSDVFLMGTFDGVKVISLAFYGMAIGLFCKQYKVVEGQMDLNSIIDFNLVNILASFVSYSLMPSLIMFLKRRGDFYELVKQGMTDFAYIILFVAITGTFILWVISKIAGSRNKRTRNV